MGYEELEKFWETMCGHIHEFNVGSIKKNEYKFCPYCGEEIKVIGNKFKGVIK